MLIADKDDMIFMRICIYSVIMPDLRVVKTCTDSVMIFGMQDVSLCVEQHLV